MLKRVKKATDCPKIVSRTIIPGNVRYNGMPNARWWQFENGRVNFGDVSVDDHEIAKSIFLDFLTLHSNDWFFVPFAQCIGTVCKIEKLCVHDVFGGMTEVKRAEQVDKDLSRSGKWSMFSLSVDGHDENIISDCFILPPSATISSIEGSPVETALFIRDEMANLVWAIEHATEGGEGTPLLGRERFGTLNPSVAETSSAAELIYRLQTEVREHWIPYLVRQVSGERMLKRAAQLGHDGERIEPLGRIVQSVPQILDKEISSKGVTVLRTVRRSRWIDGSTHLWIARRKRPRATTVETNRIGFDLAVPVQNQRTSVWSLVVK